MRKLLTNLTAISLVFIAGHAFAQPNAGAPSIADVARQNRRTPKTPATRVLTNDDLSTSAPAPQAAAAAGTQSAVGEASADAASTKPSGPVDKANALKAAWKEKVDIQKKLIADLEVQCAKSNEDLKQRSSAAYGDLGMRLRNEQKFVADDTKLRDDIGKCQEKRAAAAADLDRLLEDARKAGVEGSLD